MQSRGSTEQSVLNRKLFQFKQLVSATPTCGEKIWQEKKLYSLQLRGLHCQLSHYCYNLAVEELGETFSDYDLTV